MILEILEDFIGSYLIIITLSLIGFFLLIMKPKVATADFRPLHITLLAINLFCLLDLIEGYASEDPSLYNWRMLLSIVCYWLKPAQCLGLLFVLVTDKKKRIILLIPEIINIIVMGLAAIPGIGQYVFYFDETYTFTRGPLGLTVFIIGFLYILILLIIVFMRFRENRSKEQFLLIICGLSVAISSVGETVNIFYKSSGILTVASCLVYYLIVYIQLTSIDGLTGLYNRESFNLEMKSKRIKGLASLDMNGLKTLNDSKGHEAGDEALRAIGKAIFNHSSSKNKGYRVGGDEFIVLFYNDDQKYAEEVCEKIRKDVDACGYSVSIGLAYANGETTEELMRISDSRMYQEKEAYYAGGRDRRRK